VLPGVGIIVLTLLEGAAHRKAAMATGADDVVRKAALTTELLIAETGQRWWLSIGVWKKRRGVNWRW
jgi:CheY-like chemotaxis protein